VVRLLTEQKRNIQDADKSKPHGHDGRSPASRSSNARDDLGKREHEALAIARFML